MPVVGWGHGYARRDGAEVCGNHVGGPVPSGHPARDLHDLAAQLSSPPGEQVMPDDDLHVGGLVLDGDEYGAVAPFGVLPGHGPAGHPDPFTVLQSLYLCRGKHVGIQAWPDELHQVSPGVHAHYPVLSHHLLIGGEVGQPGYAVLHGDGKGDLAIPRGPGIQPRLPEGLPAVGRDTVEGSGHD